MKIRNAPVEVLVTFRENGLIEPHKFIYKGNIYNVDEILNRSTNNFVGNLRYVFDFKSNEEIYTLHFEVRTNIWYLFKN